MGVTEVPRGVLVLGGIAAADMPAFQTHPQVDPAIPGFDAFLAEVLVRICESDLIEMCTLSPHY